MLSDTLKTLFDLEQVFGGGPGLSLERADERVNPASLLGMSVLMVVMSVLGLAVDRSAKDWMSWRGCDWRIAEAWKSTSSLGF